MVFLRLICFYFFCWVIGTGKITHIPVSLSMVPHCHAVCSWLRCLAHDLSLSLHISNIVAKVHKRSSAIHRSSTVHQSQCRLALAYTQHTSDHSLSMILLYDRLILLKTSQQLNLFNVDLQSVYQA